MPEDIQKNFQLENILFQLLDYQSRKGTDNEDTMLMLGLVNLFGIVSVMNKQAAAVPAAVPQGRGGGMDPLMVSLLSALGGQGAREGPRAGTAPGGPGINPAMLMSLLGNQVQSPEQAMLLSLLTGMMNNPQPGRPAHGPVNSRPKEAGPGEMEAIGQKAGGPALENGDSRQCGQAVSAAAPQQPALPGRRRAEPPESGRLIKWDQRLG